MRGETGEPRGEFADWPLRKVTAIVRSDVLEKVEKRLEDLCIPGISITKVKGFGEYANFFSRDWMVEHARIEIFLCRERAHEIARVIVDAAQTGLAGDGLVVILPVEAVYRIRTGELATSDQLGGCECVAYREPDERHEDSHGRLVRSPPSGGR